jgi:hypothetical protein
MFLFSDVIPFAFDFSRICPQRDVFFVVIEISREPEPSIVRFDRNFGQPSIIYQEENRSIKALMETILSSTTRIERNF